MEDNREKLKQKLLSCFEEYKAGWLQMSPAELIARCEELEAVTRMMEILLTAVTEEEAAYLLRFKNPLEVVSNEWISRNGIDALIADDEMSHILWHLVEDRAAEDDYETESEYCGDESETMEPSM